MSNLNKIEDRIELDELIDDEGYPTERFLNFLASWTCEYPQTIEEVLDLIEHAWCHRKYGFVRRRKRNGSQTIEMHTLGWSGNEGIIESLLSNLWLTHFKLQYVKWHTGGHHYFKLKLK